MNNPHEVGPELTVDDDGFVSWPDFHDSQVIAVRLDYGGRRAFDALDASVYIRFLSTEGDIWDLCCMSVHKRGISIVGFAYQNEILDVRIYSDFVLNPAEMGSLVPSHWRASDDAAAHDALRRDIAEQALRLVVVEPAIGARILVICKGVKLLSLKS